MGYEWAKQLEELGKEQKVVKETWFYGLDMWIQLDVVCKPSYSNISCIRIRWWKYLLCNDLFHFVIGNSDQH